MHDSSPRLQVTFEPGMQLDRYELLCLLARGGMANVWLARMAGSHGFEKLLVVKTILAQQGDEHAFTEMFLDEARLASRIDHPSVVRVIDLGDYRGVPYLVMDLVEGEPLDKLVSAARNALTTIPVGIALRIVADACHGLQAAHELTDDTGTPLHVVHRDVSTQNILVSTSGRAKLIDFGIAKAHDNKASPTTAGTLKGKISFMPQEQALGKAVDARADTWALGAVLYCLLTGRPPYDEDTQLATLRLAMTGAPIAPLPPTIAPSVRQFVQRALQHDISLRFQSAAAMGEELEALVRSHDGATTHSAVATFLKAILHERLQARARLIKRSLAEAAERPRKSQVPPAATSEQSALREGHSTRPAPVPFAEEPSHTTVGAFETGVVAGLGKRSTHTFAIVAAVLMSLVGVTLFVLLLVEQKAPQANAAAAPLPSPMPPPATAAAAPVQSPSAAPSARAPTSFTAERKAVAAPAQPRPMPAPPVTTTATTRRPTPPRKLDDEAGF